MAGITLSGVGSGLDINSLVTQLVNAEAAPATSRLNRREANLQTEISALGTFKGALSELQKAVKNLTDAKKFSALTATVANGDLLAASASDTAQPGVYSVEVTQLAKAQRLATSASHTFVTQDAALGSGTLTIRFGRYDSGGAFTANPDKAGKTLVIGAGDKTLAGVRDAINQADLGVTANIVHDGSGYRLTLSAKDSGANNALEISVADDDGNDTDAAGLSLLAYGAATRNLEQTVAAQDAKAIVDGLELSSANNTFSGAIQGVTLTVQAAEPGKPTTLTVARNTASVTGAVQGFVKAYNNFINTTKALIAYDPQTQERGPLLGDAEVRSVSSQLRRSVTESVAGLASEVNSLSDIGIRTQRDGTLELDNGTLQKAVTDDAASVAALFAGAGESTGIGQRFYDFLTKQLASSGPLAKRNDSLTKRIDDIGDQRADLARKMSALQARYRAQFTAMDKLLSQLNASGSYLSQQLSGGSK
ncbi:MAG: flagellar filament capping protein FliD [Gammaproteobacteria bacterium]